MNNKISQPDKRGLWFNATVDSVRPLAWVDGLRMNMGVPKKKMLMRLEPQTHKTLRKRMQMNTIDFTIFCVGQKVTSKPEKRKLKIFLKRLMIHS